MRLDPQIHFSLPVIFWQEDQYFIAYSPTLELTTQGDSLEEARYMFVDAAQDFFETIIEQHKLDRVLADLGWKKVKGNWEPPQLISQQEQVVEVQMKNG